MPLRLRGEEFGENAEDRCPGLEVKTAELADQPGFVHRPELVEDDLAGLALEPAWDASGISLPPRGHGSDDHRPDMVVHLVR